MIVKPEEEIGPQLINMGIRQEDVKILVLTRFHTDHAGGLYHFPASQVLVTKAGDVVIVPIPGHTPGHVSVMVKSEDVT